MKKTSMPSQLPTASSSLRNLSRLGAKNCEKAEGNSALCWGPKIHGLKT